MDILLDEVDCFLLGKDCGNLEECSLHDCIDPCSESCLLSDLKSVDVVEADVLVDDLLLHLSCEVVEYLVGRNCGVEKEYTTILKVGEHVISADVSRVVASYEVSVVDEPWHIEVAVTESEVGNCDTARLLGVVSEVSLCVLICVITDDLDGVLVSTNCTIRTETPELAGYYSLWSNVDWIADWDGSECDIIVDTDCEVVVCLVRSEEVEY